MPERPLISVVIPAFNEENNIVPLHEALSAVFADEMRDVDAEFIFVDDGSRDDTFVRLLERQAADSRVRLIRLSRNFGQQAAFSAGLEGASGDAVVTMDCDLQDPPRVIPALFEQWRGGYPVVCARRRSRSESRFKRWTAEMYYRFLARISHPSAELQVGDFRLLDRSVVRVLTRMPEDARYLRGMVTWLGFKSAFVDFDRGPRAHGQSQYTLAGMLRLGMDGIFNTGFNPLGAGFALGLIHLVGSVGLFLYYLGQAAAGNAPSLFEWLIVLLIGCFGLQFICAWIISVYLQRIYRGARKRPLFIVAETVNIPLHGPV
ncbi:MAG: glycosyltransferase family 2 protein [Verrucomicrobiota bacterium]